MTNSIAIKNIWLKEIMKCSAVPKVGVSQSTKEKNIN